MIPDGKQAGLALAAMVLFIAVVPDHAQQIPAMHATAFSSDMYFEPPNEEKVKMRLSGTESLPLPGGSLDIKNLKIETFGTNGATQMQAESPQCTYRLLEGTADSPSHLEMRSGDGRLHVEGDGYTLILSNTAMSLSLSNHVHTVIQAQFLKP